MKKDFTSTYNNQKNQENFSQNEFLSAISHELKTPLNAILGFCDILKEKIKDSNSASLSFSSSSNSSTSTKPNFLDPEFLDYIKEINHAALEMKELVLDLLDVGAIASGNFSVDLGSEIDICDIIKRAVRLNYDYALKRNVSLKIEIADDVKLIKLDAKRMKQILTNLISNAVKYSPQKSEVKIICKNIAPHPLKTAFKPNPEFLEISVIDQGFGMTKQQIEIAFQKYQTIQNPNSGSVDSFGLGLPITKQLIELQNGNLEVSSEVNKGTAMKMKFPYSL